MLQLYTNICYNYEGTYSCLRQRQIMSEISKAFNYLWIALNFTNTFPKIYAVICQLLSQQRSMVIVSTALSESRQSMMLLSQSLPLFAREQLMAIIQRGLNSVFLLQQSISTIYPNYRLQGAILDMAVTMVVKDWAVEKGRTTLNFVSQFPVAFFDFEREYSTFEQLLIWTGSVVGSNLLMNQLYTVDQKIADFYLPTKR